MTGSLWIAVISLLLTPMLLAQELEPDPFMVSLYQLEHKPPKDARRLFEKATLEIKQARFETSIKLLEKAVDLDPHYWEAENGLGYAYLKLKLHNRAEQAFQQAINIDPENAAAYTNLGVSALLLGDYKLAEQSAQRALRWRPRCAEAKALLALVLVGEGQWTLEAHKLLTEASPKIAAAQALLQHWEESKRSRPQLTFVSSANGDPSLLNAK